MSLGPSSLGNLLVQRLDTVLGISQSSPNSTGAHPDALRQAQPVHRILPNDGLRQRSGQESVDKAREGRSQQVQNRPDGRLAQQYTDNRFTPSAPTTLGRTARTILALLTQYQNQPVQGDKPLFQPRQFQQALNPALHTAAPTSSPSATAATPSQPTASAPATAQHAPPTAPSTPQAPSTATPALVQVFAQALSQNVQHSGMFYEAQLAQLVKGEGNLQLLQQQPQAQLPAPGSSPSAPASTTHAPPSPPHTNTPPSAAVTLQQSGIDPAAQQLVRQQLEVLANQLFTWRGEAWPGADMAWDIQRRHEDENAPHSALQPDDPNPEPWQTRLRLDLPRLGEIDAKLYMDDKRLRIQINAPDSSEQLKAHVQNFAQRLQALGLQVDQLHIQRHDPLFADDAHDEH